MSFVSYAQNFEDVMLWRALNHVKNGFYIDVGANDPEIESVTKAFYDYGWHGINIEPLVIHHESLLQARPRDINLLCAVGDKKGEIDIFECDVRGWATGAQNFIEKQIKEGHQGKYHRVPLRTLTDICKEFAPEDIHFLKIDVEGLEKEVVFGADFNNFRPWIVVLEATKPNSTDEAYEDWEPALIKADYHFAYADGLNRFYVSKEHFELMHSLRYPPNVFDEFIRIEQHSSVLKNKQLEIRIGHAEDKLQQAELRAGQAELRAGQAELRAGQAELRAGQAELRAGQAELRAGQAELRAGQAETIAKQSDMRAEQAEASAKQAEVKAQQAEAIAQENIDRAEHTQAMLTDIYNSRLWRMTAPWRWAGNVARWLIRGSIAWLTFAPGSRPRRVIRSMLSYLERVVTTHPQLKASVTRLLSSFPQLYAHLRLVENPHFAALAHTFYSEELSNNAIEDLSPRAKKIYIDLKAAIELRQKEQL